jgi:endoglucanase
VPIFTEKAWEKPMPDKQFELMRDIIAAPSPVGLEAAMTEGVLVPAFAEFQLQGWGVHRYRGNAGVVFDTHPGREDMLSVMLIGHADKIRMQVKSIADDGKIWIESDSFLPLTLLGHEITLFSEDPAAPGAYRAINGGTVEALGAIHFADDAVRTGAKGINPNQLYVELQLWGDNRKKQVEALGIKQGDPIILNRPIKRGFSPQSFYGAYLDNGLGCFVATEVARIIAGWGGLKNVRVQFAMAAYEEIGRMGSRVLAHELRPDVVIAVDVNHDYASAPGVGDKHFNPLAMGKGFTLTVGAIATEYLNSLILAAARDEGIPVQKSVSGRDTGTDGMAAVFASIDSAATSVGFPIRNMHTISESGHTGDVIACIHGLAAALKRMDEANDGRGLTSADFRSGHPRLDRSAPLAWRG